MKTLHVFLLTGFIAALTIAGCSKDENGSLHSKNYALYNYSSGSAQPAGSFTLSEISGGNASLSIQLDQGYLVPGVMLKSYLIIKDTITGIELIYANLNDIDGSTGQATTSPIVNSSTNAPIGYDAIVSDPSRYSVKVLNNNNVQAIGEIQ